MHCPALGKVPGISQNELHIKATATGITFLHERKYKKRYTGSKTCAVDINGGLWQKSADLDNHVKNLGEKFKSRNGKTVAKKDKKKGNLARCPLVILHAKIATQVIGNESCVVSGAISEKNTDCADFATNVAKKVREKSYSVNKKEVRQRILGYINTMKGLKTLFFWTVSFPAGTPDDVCYQAFNTWLTTLRMRRKNKDGRLLPPMLREYLWIAERQMGNRLQDKTQAPTGTIHFHIAIPHYMDVQRANAMMRGTLKNLAKKGLLPGAVAHAKSGETYYLPCIAKYNGVDICKHRTTKRVVNFAVKKGSRALATYLTKYVTKNNAGTPAEPGETPIPGFDHLAWHNSRGFTALFTGVTFTIEEFTKFGFGPYLNKVRQFRMNFATFIPWLYGPPPLLYDHLYQLNSYIQTILDNGK